MAPFGPDRKVLHGSDAETTRREPPCPGPAYSMQGLRLPCSPAPAEAATTTTQLSAATRHVAQLPSPLRMNRYRMVALEILPLPQMKYWEQHSRLSWRRWRLGERFGWCAGVQALWDAQDQARAETEAAAVAHEAAVRVYEAATDDLDRAEAGEAAQDAYTEYVFAAGDYGKIRWRAAGLIFNYEAIVPGGGVEDADPASLPLIGPLRPTAPVPPLTLWQRLTSPTRQPETATRVSAVANSDSDEPAQAVEAPESESAPLDRVKGVVQGHRSPPRRRRGCQRCRRRSGRHHGSRRGSSNCCGRRRRCCPGHLPRRSS